jgi:hypothetical protein
VIATISLKAISYMKSLPIICYAYADRKQVKCPQYMVTQNHLPVHEALVGGHNIIIYKDKIVERDAAAQCQISRCQYPDK